MNIVSVVTIFNPNKIIYRNIEILSQYVSKVILTDNSNIDHDIKFNDIENVIHLRNFLNLGLSGAFNKALQLKECIESDFLFFFDQDSRIDYDYIQGMIDEFVSIEKYKKVGCIGPSILDESDKSYNFPKQSKRIIEEIYEVQIIITSGMLTKYKIISECGLWNEKIFLDFADWDLCWRLKQSGFGVFQTRKLKMSHSLGQGILMIFGFKLRVNNEIRIYYIIRDGLKLLFKPYVPMNYKFYFLRTAFISPWVQLIFFQNRFKRLKYILIGYLHTCLRKKGSLS